MNKNLVVTFLVGVGALVAARRADAQTVLPRGGWVATGSSTGSGTAAASAIDGSASSRWSTGASQTSGQWFSLDMITPQTISQVTLDQGSSSADYPRAFQVFVSNDAVTWGAPIASGSGAAGVNTIVFPTQTARFVGIVQTAGGPNAWSISEINVYGPGAVPTVALNPGGWGASASSTGGADVASRALDGLVSTRWSTGAPQASGQSFQLDLRAPQTLTKLQLDAGPSTSDYPRAFQVFATNDTASWGAAIATGTGTSSLVQVSFPQKTARYVKIVLTGTSSSWWSIAELTVFGVGDFSPVAMALPRFGWTATASVICPGDVPSRAFDDNASTRFSTGVNQASGQTFTLDMQVPRAFTKVTLDAAGSSGDYPRGYQLYVSNDGATWGAPVAAGAGTSALVTITFPSQTARYLKIVQTGSSSSSWWSIAELNVYGTPPVELLRNGWVATASHASASAGGGIDGNLSTRWTANTPQANGQWYQVDMRTAQTFDQILLDATGFAGDYPRGYQVFASNSATTFGAPIATGVATSAVVSIGFATQTARYLRVVQTGSASSWWSIAELNVFAAPEVVQIEDYLAKAFYSKSDVASSFVSTQGEAVDCIAFEAQPSVKAWRARGVAMPTAWPTAASGAPAPAIQPGLAFAGQPDANGNPQRCGTGLVPVTRPTVQKIKDAGGVAAYKAALKARPRPQGAQHPVQHDCWLNSAPGDGTPEHAEDWEHVVGLQTSGFQPAGATGYYGARAVLPVYSGSLHTDGDHTNAQWWIQTGTCENWFNSTADIISGDPTKNQCRTGAACTTCTGAACDGCAVQSLEMTPFKTGGDSTPHLSVFYTTDAYFQRNCWAGVGASCAGCPIAPGATEPGDCFVAMPGAKYKADMLLGTNMSGPGTGSEKQYGVAPFEVMIEAWRGTSGGTAGWWLFVNGEPIGMFPPETFNWPDGTPGPLSNGPATYLQVGGEVYNTWPNGNHTRTSMYSDNRAEDGYKYAAYARNVAYFDAGKTLHDAVLSPITTPPEEGDQGILGLCGLNAASWLDPFGGARGGYTSAFSDVPAGGDGWGTYFYFGGGMDTNERGPGRVVINVHQYAACDLVPTPQGNVTVAPSAAYLVVDMDGLANTAARAIDFHFDPAQLYLVDPVTGQRDHVDPALPLTQEIFGPFAMTPGTVTAGSDQSFTIPYHMALRVQTSNANGPAEASTTRYELRYERKAGDPPVLVINSTSASPHIIANSNCRQIGLTNP